MILLDYIKNSIDILIDLKSEEKLEAFKKQNNLEDDQDNQNLYEGLLRKLESDIRQHIRVFFINEDGTPTQTSLRKSSIKNR